MKIIVEFDESLNNKNAINLIVEQFKRIPMVKSVKEVDDKGNWNKTTNEVVDQIKTVKK